jgi:hypothetical protein
MEMRQENSHLSDEQLVRDVDGELAAGDRKPVKAHLDACWKCRARRQELEKAITDFVRVHEQEFDARLPPAAGPRALLKARLGQLSAAGSSRATSERLFAWSITIGACAFVALGLWLARTGLDKRVHHRSGAMVVSMPVSTLTPGATLLVDRRVVCAGQNSNNRTVSVPLQRRVFEQYGISGADPRAYEIDYLITPALGGAEDIHNLWPHSYSATVWNAKVKDDLENRLRKMVCDGDLDLATAQQEIAGNWIAAYKKYFNREMPLPTGEK